MNGWIWFGIIVIVLFIAWLSLKPKKKDNYGMVRSSGGGFWDAVKDACCIRNKR